MALWHTRASFYFLLSSLDVLIKQHNAIIDRENIQKNAFFVIVTWHLVYFYFYFFLHECIYSSYVLVPTKARRGFWIPWKETEVVMSHCVHSGDRTCVLCKINKHFWLTASSLFCTCKSKAQFLNPIIISKIGRRILLLTAKHNFKKSNLRQKGMCYKIAAKIIVL